MTSVFRFLTEYSQLKDVAFDVLYVIGDLQCFLPLNPSTSGDRKFKKKLIFFNISGVYEAIFEFDIWKNAELQALYNEYSSKSLLCVLCALLTDLADFEFQKLL